MLLTLVSMNIVSKNENIRNPCDMTHEFSLVNCQIVPFLFPVPEVYFVNKRLYGITIRKTCDKITYPQICSPTHGCKRMKTFRKWKDSHNK